LDSAIIGITGQLLPPMERIGYLSLIASM